MGVAPKATEVGGLALCLSLLAPVACGPAVAGSPEQVTEAASGTTPSFVLVAPEHPESDDEACDDCHDEEEAPNATPRRLEDDHEQIVLDHGAGRIWCLSCHHPRKRTELTDPKGEPIPRDRVDLACAGCHQGEHRDFLHGVHGRRLERWRGERKLLTCTGCHPPHAPAILPRKPAPPPSRPASAAAPAPRSPAAWEAP